MYISSTLIIPRPNSPETFLDSYFVCHYRMICIAEYILLSLIHIDEMIGSDIILN